jgi:pimeloyl-ACP methyl ester carboxylesterase
MREQTFQIAVTGRRVPGVIWMPDGSAVQAPLVLAGHGFTLHKRALYPVDLPDRLTALGLAVAAIDAPGHGDRQPDGGRDAGEVDRAWRAHWREHGGLEIAAEWQAVLDALQDIPEIDATQVAYWGLSLGTQSGLAFLASEPRVGAAVLGLSALPEPGPRIEAYARGVSCPVLFIQQLDDEVATRTRSSALFERLGSTEKTLRSSPGGHMEVPEEVFREACAFLAEHLT